MSGIALFYKLWITDLAWNIANTVKWLGSVNIKVLDKRAKAPANWLQHLHATLLGATCWARLATLLWRVATCWVLLAQMWEWSNFFHASFLDVAWCCSCLARFVQQCYTRACALVRFFNTQHVTTRRTRMAKRANIVAIFCSKMLRSFGRSSQILGQQCWYMLCHYMLRSFGQGL